ncbi:MAG: hypothetical protein SGJ21_05985 [Alphaproteobacteria bacterium]|nr:hypothetical protein [Alphaproteobacteria bacterium]
MPLTRSQAIKISPLAVAALFLAVLAACASSPAPAELTDQKVCMQHYENDPVERDRCQLNAETRRGAPPDVRAQDLPIRSGQISD